MSVSYKDVTVSRNELSNMLLHSANKTLKFFEMLLERNGSYGENANDLACYFKSPMLFIAARKFAIAKKILDHIKASYMRKDGDFNTSEKMKSYRPEYTEYWAYCNGWILRAAYQLGVTSISRPAYKYIMQYYAGSDKGFLTKNIHNQSTATDVFTTAHLGLINLEMDQMEFAIAAGNYLCSAFNMQSSVTDGFYLRFDKNGRPITEFTHEESTFYFVNTKEPNQRHFMVGYPSAYLALLYKKTGDTKYLLAAKDYLDFALSCDSNVYESNYSLKLSWASSILYSVTKDKRYLNVIEKICRHFLDTQTQSGTWHPNSNIYILYDQSAEIAYWFLEIAKNIHS